jgi:hypothetical protein
MKTADMTQEDFQRYGIEESDMPAIWDAFYKFQRGGMSGLEEWEQDGLDAQIMQDEERIERIRQEEMEYWEHGSHSVNAIEMEREAALEAISSNARAKDNGIER